jgi:phospholipid transport system substrate-binding protein
VSVGKFWRQLGRDQKILLVDTFTELSIATYADRFAGYSGENFKAKSQRRFGQDRALVRSVLSKPRGKKRNFDSMLKRFNGAWRIVNITVKWCERFGD